MRDKAERTIPPNSTASTCDYVVSKYDCHTVSELDFPQELMPNESFTWREHEISILEDTPKQAGALVAKKIKMEVSLRCTEHMVQNDVQCLTWLTFIHIRRFSISSDCGA